MKLLSLFLQEEKRNYFHYRVFVYQNMLRFIYNLNAFNYLRTRKDFMQKSITCVFLSERVQSKKAKKNSH